MVKYVWVWISAPFCSCVVLHRGMTLLVSVYSATCGCGYKVTLLLQNRQDLLLESYLRMCQVVLAQVTVEQGSRLSPRDCLGPLPVL